MALEIQFPLTLCLEICLGMVLEGNAFEREWFFQTAVSRGTVARGYYSRILAFLCFERSATPRVVFGYRPVTYGPK
ncbi:hypothetical protein IMCC26256_111834 [Actinobacteria bacterium IMCC26256]|nr:hypothetical protein IMCC26256_111834 [Actinobacteria bacterium IMCC26256]